MRDQSLTCSSQAFFSILYLTSRSAQAEGALKLLLNTVLFSSSTSFCSFSFSWRQNSFDISQISRTDASNCLPLSHALTFQEAQLQTRTRAEISVLCQVMKADPNVLQEGLNLRMRPSRKMLLCCTHMPGDGKMQQLPYRAHLYYLIPHLHGKHRA